MAQARRSRVPPETSTSQRKQSGKLAVGEPGSFTNFFIVLGVHICRKILLVRTTVKLAVYFFATSVLSVVTDAVRIPKSYFSDKQNLLNQYFVKLGWGWTLSLLIPFVYLTSKTYCCGRKSLIQMHMLRLVVGTFWWYFCTKTFNWIENSTGICNSMEMEHHNKKVCRDAGFDWVGFDVSGHAFLLIHCLLIISEEVRCIEHWSKIGELIKKEDQRITRLSESELNLLKTSYERDTPKIKWLMLALTLLQLMWELMLLTTVLYFHNMPQKFLASVFAAGAWFLSYRVWYRNGALKPDPPGVGAIRYMN